ncbi:ankyrin repeat-containing domain protein [Aspergillus bertholletiae]|uniref:Ankyrin repeat-containing domain protein n=1 Tax=Aspergillus bertholletiae TaxID=1226010 RepID=A0A5N7B7C0_9EURO|nr:ankyrin repeat-containing domain protein [Aspergillus bertholletiae]
MTDAEWEPFKPDIERLYCHEKNTLHEVMEYMKSKYAFEKSKGQYQRQLKKWGLRKSLQSSTINWPFIGRRIEKRKIHQQKDSEVHINGVQIPPSKLKRAKYRESFTTSEVAFSGAPSPNTPEGIIVCTPAAPGMDLAWNPSLPWLRFAKLLRPGIEPDQPSPSSSLTVPSPKELRTSSQIDNQKLMQRLVSTVSWNKLSQPPNIYSSSRTATALTIIMPEEFAGQHLILSSDLSDSKQKDSDRIALELFLLSNNLVSHKSNARLPMTKRKDDQRIIETFNTSGWNNVQHLQILISSHEPTAAAIVEKLFASTLRSLDLKTLKNMLEARIDPNAAVETIYGRMLTPLQFASTVSSEKSLEVSQLLLTHGANVSLSYNGLSALDLAIEYDQENVIHFLLAHGAIVTPSCLCSAAVSRINDQLLAELIDACPNINELTRLQDPSALAQAVKGGRVIMTCFLLENGAEVNQLSSVDFEYGRNVTTVLGLAAWDENQEFVQLLLGACEYVNPDFVGIDYVSPLTLAVEAGNPEVAEILLQAGVSVRIADENSSRTLIERATKKMNLALCQLLVNHGAQVDWPISDTMQTCSALLVAIEKKAFDIVDVLINAGARLNDEYTRPPGTVLGAAIELGDRLLVNKLLSAGARVLNGQIRSFGNLGMAVYLQEFMVFQSILQTSGQQILAAALSSRDKDLAQYLLVHDADLKGGLSNPRGSISEKTPLQAATKTHSLDFVETLLNRGAIVTDEDLAAELSVRSGCLQNLLRRFRGSAPTAVGTAIYTKQSLEILRDTGVDPTGVPQMFHSRWDLDNDFDLEFPASVLDIAAVFGYEDLKPLLQWVHWDKRLTGRALTIAIFMRHHEIADELLQYGADEQQEISVEYRSYNYDDDDGNLERRRWETFSPLQVAVKYQLGSIAQKLVQFVDVNHLGEGARRRTPLQHAVENGDMDLINLLLQHGARVDGPPARDGGATALQIAAIQGYIGIARRLIDLGASVNEPPATLNGRTALQGAAEHGRIDMLQMLLDEGALVVGDGEQEYERAVQLGKRNGHHAAVRLLQSFRKSVQLSTSETT